MFTQLVKAVLGISLLLANLSFAQDIKPPIGTMETYEAYATSYWHVPHLYYTQTTIVYNNEGELGTMMVCAIPLFFYTENLNTIGTTTTTMKNYARDN